MFAAKNELFTRPGAGYQISRSVRLRSSASAYFNRTFGTPTNASKWTKSFWVKRGTLGTVPILASQTVNASANYALQFNSDSTFSWQFSNTLALQTTQVFRDPSAWYHFVLVWDSANATAANRAILYVNGVQVTSFSVDNRSSVSTSQNAWETAGTGYLSYTNGTNSFDGYLTEVNFIDGQALTPTSFGQFNSTTGVWQPIRYAGTYGTNGFYINFSDNSAATAAAIGKDYSGNGNNWTPNNISVASGVTYDSMIDVPTVSATGSNYAVINPLAVGADATISNANLSVAYGTSATVSTTLGSFGMTSGQWYWENTVTASSLAACTAYVGLVNQSNPTGAGSYPGATSRGWSYYGNLGTFYNNGSTIQSGLATYGTNDVIGVAFDADAGTLKFYKNNTQIGTTITGIPSDTYYAAWSDGSVANTFTIAANFGQRPFTYTPPSGFVALNTQNLPAPTISNGALYMNATTYSGTTGVQAVTNSGGMQPDLVWIKVRNIVANHVLQDSVRGTTAYLQSNVTTAENTNTSYDWFRSFNSNGFTVASSTTGGTPTSEWNTSGNTYVGWQWQAGKGTTSSNTSGSITSTVSVNATAGFSIVTYTGTGANATVGHGLGVAPSMYIVKSRSNGTTNWCVYHSSVGNQYATLLNSTSAPFSNINYWNNTSPTSSVFSLGNGTDTNQSTGTYVAYCFSAVRGYSAFGSYTGNGSSDGPFVYLGFRPRWVMIKNTSAVNQWNLWDTSRNTYNVMNDILVPSSSGAETNSYPIDILSNGFKIRGGAGLAMNDSSNVYIYACFAENPFKLALAR